MVQFDANLFRLSGYFRHSSGRGAWYEKPPVPTATNEIRIFTHGKLFYCNNSGPSARMRQGFSSQKTKETKSAVFTFASRSSVAVCWKKLMLIYRHHHFHNSTHVQTVATDSMVFHFFAARFYDKHWMKSGHTYLVNDYWGVGRDETSLFHRRRLGQGQRCPFDLDTW